MHNMYYNSFSALASLRSVSSSTPSQQVACTTGDLCRDCVDDRTRIISPFFTTQNNVIRKLRNRFNPDGVAGNEEDVCCGLCSPILGISFGSMKKNIY